MIRDSAYIYDVVGLEAEGTKVDFQVGAASYLYGTRFISYLALQYGPEKLMQWFTQTPESKSEFLFTVRSRLRNVPGHRVAAVDFLGALLAADKS